jgi:PIN domain nuclease of toxin-antitoxin system
LILLDTQALVWFSQGDERLGVQAREIARQEATIGEAAVSPISFWEVSMLTEKGRISLGMETLDWMEAILAQPGVRLEQLSPALAIDAGRLPGDIHGDPADRMIVATARHLVCPVLTTDQKILAYALQGHVQAIDARL